MLKVLHLNVLAAALRVHYHPRVACSRCKIVLRADLAETQHLVQALIVGRLQKKLILGLVLHVAVGADQDDLLVPPVGLFLVVALVEFSH